MNKGIKGIFGTTWHPKFPINTPSAYGIGIFLVNSELVSLALESTQC